jgi:hypothetical protein
MIFSLKPTFFERIPLYMLGSNKKNPQPIFTIKTVPESVEDEFFSMNLLSGIHKGAGYQLVAQKGMAIPSKGS